MRQFFKFIGVLLLAFVLVVIGVLVYQLFGSSSHRSPVSIIPKDAVMIVETENVSELLKEVTESDFWNSIIEGDVFKEVKQGMVSFDRTLKENKWLLPILRNQKLALSWHQLVEGRNDFVVVVDVKKYSHLNLIPKISSAFNYPVKQQIVDSIVAYSLSIPELNETVHLVSIDNLLIGSSSYQLLEKIIFERSTNNIDGNDGGSEIFSVFTKGQINVYMNTDKVQDFFMKDSGARYLNGIAYTALGGSFSHSSFNLEGFSSCYDSVSSPFIPLLKSQSGKREAEKVIPSNAMFYLNFNLKNFDQFYHDFLIQYSDLDPIGYAAYMGGMKITESYLGIHVKEDFLSWMSGEMALATMRPASNARENDFIVAVKSNNIKNAQIKLDDISKKIKNRTSVKFNRIEYKNHEINYLNIRGFFKVIMGNFFANRERPYYTIVDDYVIFSNSSDMLMQVIDSYLVGNTLQRNESFQKINTALHSKSQITAYVHMQRLYEHLYYYSNFEHRNSLSAYKEILEKIGLVGVQMYPENNLLKTKLITRSDTEKALSQELALIALSSEELVMDEFKSLDFKIDLGDEFVDYNGDLYYYLSHPQKVQDSVLVYKGELEKGVMQGIWRTYFYSGNIKSAVMYQDGFVNGTAVFYFDNNDHTIRAEIDLDNDSVDGVYSEYYPNGNIKANVEFKNGSRWGDARYYYQNGSLKIEGHFKKDHRSGNWRYYSKTGELMKKENW